MTELTRGRLGGIEAGRGIAATAVVLSHAARHLDKIYGAPLLLGLFQAGHAGVDFFFVISGFIITFVHAGDIGRPARLGHYLNRRLTRVLPAYWVALAMTIAMTIGGGKHDLPDLLSVVRSVTLWPSDTEPLLGIAWTLQFEMVFYAAFAVLILNRIAGFGLLALWAAWIVAGLTGHADADLPALLHSAYCLEFFLGMAVAWLLRTRAVPAPRRMAAIGAGLFLCAGIAENAGLIDGTAAPSRVWYGVPAALMVLGVAEADRRGLIRVPALLRTLGSASYSIYLFQFVFIGTLWHVWLAAGLDLRTPHLASFLPLAAAGVIGGVIMSQLIEYPLMRLIRRHPWLTRARQPPGHAVPKPTGS